MTTAARVIMAVFAYGAFCLAIGCLVGRAIRYGGKGRR